MPSKPGMILSEKTLIQQAKAAVGDHILAAYACAGLCWIGIRSIAAAMAHDDNDRPRNRFWLTNNCWASVRGR